MLILYKVREQKSSSSDELFRISAQLFNYWIQLDYSGPRMRPAW